MRKVYITNNHIISSLGMDSETNFDKLVKGISGIKEYQRPNGQKYFTSLIDKEKINAAFSKIQTSKKQTILEKMMILSVNHILEVSKIKITNKTGLIISTTKGNVDTLASNSAFYQDKQRAYLSELGNQLQHFFGFKNETIVLSNACVSGVLAVSVAKHLIQSAMYDEVIVVSGDLVSEFILSGFESFQAISSQPCKPYSKNRTGITIGEAIASVLVSKNISKNANEVVEVIGTASCNDANHISGPSRTGEGLFLSVQSALKEAQIEANQVDYISAHGTATNYNDEMESIAFDRLAMNKIPLNSLKGFYGHTLGASGLLETIIGIKSLYHNKLIATIGFDEIGVSKPLNIIEKTTNKNLNIFLKTASGFGGSNSAALFKRIN
jgi:3-oxoacyl-[acyl-carrier-protein] synthase-1